MSGEIVAIVFFSLFFSTIMRWLRYREKRLELPPKGKPSRELEAMREERKLLVQRIENLESIVCDVDHELNLQIRRLVEQTGAASLLAAPAATPTPARTGSTGAPAAAATPAPSPTATTPTAMPPSTALDLGRATPSGTAPARATAELDVGAVVENRYRIQRLLGRGGMGAVYLADDEVLGESVALKVISSAHHHEPDETIQRFRREASAARKVSSPHVIRIHDLGQTRAGQLYISMEYFPGQTLAQLLGARGTLGMGEIRDILGQVCDGLAAAHGSGVIHRDLKPQNVLVGHRNAVKLIDFGLAKISYLAGLTATGLIMGTPQYMSPEQIKGLETDARSDIYSLGALFYHAVTGRPPFGGATPIAIGFAHLSEPPRPPRELRPELSAGLNDAILAALAKQPSERPQTVDELRRAL